MPVPRFVRVPLPIVATLFGIGLTLVPGQLCAQVNTAQDQQSHRQWAQEMQRLQEIKEQQAHSNALESYERFDPKNPGKATSEWEFFDDPRTAKKKTP